MAMRKTLRMMKDRKYPNIILTLRLKVSMMILFKRTAMRAVRM